MLKNIKRGAVVRPADPYKIPVATTPIQVPDIREFSDILPGQTTFAEDFDLGYFTKVGAYFQS